MHTLTYIVHWKLNNKHNAINYKNIMYREPDNIKEVKIKFFRSKLIYTKYKLYLTLL